MTPSMKSFAFRTVMPGAGEMAPSSYCFAKPAIRATAPFGSPASAGSIGGAKWARAVRPPARRTAANAAMSAGRATASRKLVTPWAFIALRATFAAATSSSAVGLGINEPNTSNAASSSRPVGCPLASRQILPPTGSGVVAVIFASCRARVLASTV